MEISNIDPDMVEIVNKLNDANMNPIASCDGVIDNHSENNRPENAYFSMLKSPQVIKCLSKMKGAGYGITMSTSTHKKPYELYGNEISGNTYSVYFENEEGQNTKKVNDLLEEGINDSFEKGKNQKEVNFLTILDKKLNECDEKRSNLYFTVDMNQTLRPGVCKKENRLIVGTKYIEGSNLYRDLTSILTFLEVAIDIPSVKTDKDFNLPEIIDCENGETINIYISDNKLKMIPTIIDMIHDLEPSLTQKALPEYDYFEECKKELESDVIEPSCKLPYEIESGECISKEINKDNDNDKEIDNDRNAENQENNGLE